MSDEKQAGSEHFPDELQFQKNTGFAMLNYDRVGAGQYEGQSQTAFNKPYNKPYLLTSNVRSLPQNLLTLLSLGEYGKVSVWSFPVKTSLSVNN